MKERKYGAKNDKNKKIRKINTNLKLINYFYIFFKLF